MEKILYNRLLRPVLAVVMVVSLALGVASSAWPAARQSARIEVLAEAGITNLRTLSIAVTELGEDRLAALIKTPMQGNDFKKMSGLLTEVRDAAGYDRIWLTAQKDGKTIVLCDSSYRDTGTAGVTYLAPGSEWTGPLAEKLGSGVSGLLSGKTEDAYTKSPVETGSDTPMLGIAAVVRDKNGTPAAALVAQFPAADIDFPQLGFVDLGLVSWLGFLLFALSLALLVLISRLRKKFPKPTPPEPTDPEPADFTAEGFESAPAPELPEAPAADQPSGANFDPMTGEPINKDPQPPVNPEA